MYKVEKQQRKSKNSKTKVTETRPNMVVNIKGLKEFH